MSNRRFWKTCKLFLFKQYTHTWCAYQRIRNVSFREIKRTYWMEDPIFSYPISSIFQLKIWSITLCNQVVSKAFGLSKWKEGIVKKGIRTIVPEENCSPVRVGASVKVRVSFRVEGQPDNCPGGKLPPGRVRVWVRVSFGIGWQFSSGAIVLEPPKRYIQKSTWTDYYKRKSLYSYSYLVDL